MEDIKKPLIRSSVRTDTLNQASFFNSFIMGQAVKKRSQRSRKKIELTLDQIDLIEIYSESSGYILKNAENTIATPFTITCLDYSNEEGIFLFGSSNGNISRYDIKECKIIDDIPLNIGMIRSIVLDDEENAIVVGETPVVRIYKLPRFELDCELNGHTLAVNKCEINYVKRLAFTVSDDCTVHMWDLDERIDKGVIMTHTGMGKSLALTKCGKYVFSGGEDFLIRVYDMDLSEEILNLKSHVGCIWSLATNEESSLLASGGADNLVIVWNILDFTPMHVFAEHLGVVNTVKFNEESTFLISGSSDNSMKVWDLEKDRREITLNSHTGPIHDILISQECDYIISCSEDKSLKIWSYPEFMEESNFKVLNNDFNSVIQVGVNIISCGSDHKVRYWNRETDEAGVFHSTNGVGLKCCISLDKQFIAIADDYGFLYLFSSTYEHIKDFQAHKGPIRDMCFLRTGELVTGGGDSKVLIWNIETWECRQLRGHQQSIWCLGYCQYDLRSDMLASGSSDKTIRLWSTTSGYELMIFQVQEQPTALCMTNEGRYIVSGGILGTVVIWSIAERAEESVFKLHTDMVTGIFIGEKNETILSVSKDRSLHFTSLQYRMPISFITRKQPILSLALSEDTSDIITGEHQMIYIQDNPIVSNKVRVLGPEENVQKFLTYMKSLINGQVVPHDITMDKFIIVPYFFNTLHFYTYLGLKENLTASLTETATMIPSKNGYHPLYIALLKGFKVPRDEIIEALITLGETNPFIFQILENVMVKMNKNAFPKLGSLYNALYKPANRKTLPNFCAPDIDLPLVKISSHSRISPEDFFEQGDTSSHGQGILFIESYVRISYTMGSKDSIEFLESLAECSNLDVMRSPLIQAMVRFKWENAKYPMMIQGICFYVYLLLLSCYTTFALGNTYYTACLFLINTILLLYEAFQMSVSGSFYFSYVWNYIDWSRSITLYGYIVINWVDKDNTISDSMLSVSIFLSFVRGISYFRLFKLTRYLINLLFQVVQDIQGFLVLLVYSTLGFCFLFIVLSRGKEDSDESLSFSTYLMGSYNLVLGNFDIKEYNIVEYAVLTFALLINPIIMLNLLISIIGDTYDRVQSDNLSADMKELMDMIQEVENMLFFRRTQNRKEFFQECTEYEKQDLDSGWEGKLRGLQNSITSIQDKGTENHKEVLKRLKIQNKVLTTQSEQIEEILKKLNEIQKPAEGAEEKKAEKKPKKTLVRN